MLSYFVVAGLSELYCGDDFQWEWQDNFVSDGCKIAVDESLYDYYNDQGYAENEDEEPDDGIENKEIEHDPEDFDLEGDDDSDDSDF